MGQQGTRHPLRRGRQRHPDRRLERRRLARRRRRHRRRHRQRLHRRRQRRVLLPQRPARPAHARPRGHRDLRHEHPDGTDGLALVTGTVQNDPTGDPPVPRINLLDHSDAIEAEPRTDLWGDDYIAGGAGRRRDLRPARQRRHPGRRLRRRPRARRRTRTTLTAAGRRGRRCCPTARAGHADRRLARRHRRTATRRSSSTRRVEAGHRRRRLHRGQRRQRHDLRRPRPGRHRRRQLRPVHLRPRRPARHDRRPVRALADHRRLGRRQRRSRSSGARSRRRAQPAARATITVGALVDHGRRHGHADRPLRDHPDARRLRLEHGRLLPRRRRAGPPAPTCIFGGAGTEIARNDPGAGTIAADGTTTW